MTNKNQTSDKQKLMPIEPVHEDMARFYAAYHKSGNDRNAHFRQLGRTDTTAAEHEAGAWEDFQAGYKAMTGIGIFK